jgi:hypothetical protein
MAMISLTCPLLLPVIREMRGDNLSRHFYGYTSISAEFEC